MKLFMRPIKMISLSEIDGELVPIKFKIETKDNTNKVIKVDRVVNKRVDKIAGNKMFIYKVVSYINNIEKAYELKYELATCKWYLYKM